MISPINYVGRRGQAKSHVAEWGQLKRFFSQKLYENWFGLRKTRFYTEIGNNSALTGSISLSEVFSRDLPKNKRISIRYNLFLLPAKVKGSYCFHADFRKSGFHQTCLHV